MLRLLVVSCEGDLPTITYLRVQVNNFEKTTTRADSIARNHSLSNTPQEFT